jgi:hypothetical protein
MFDQYQKPLGYYNAMMGPMSTFGQQQGGGSGIPSWAYGLMGGMGGAKTGQGL